MKPPTPSPSTDLRTSLKPTYPVIDLNSRSPPRRALSAAETMVPRRDRSIGVSSRIRRSDSRSGAPDWNTKALVVAGLWLTP